jgi:hypothetical protein
MSEGGSAIDRGEASDLDIRALMNLVQAAMVEIEQAKRERSTDDVRAARTQLAALHGVARLRRQAERDQSAA